MEESLVMIGITQSEHVLIYINAKPLMERNWSAKGIEFHRVWEQQLLDSLMIIYLF